MSLANIPATMLRIHAATQESPIAVFKTHSDQREKLESLFAGTVRTWLRIRKDQKNLIGIFDNTMAPSKVLNTLYANLDDSYER